VQPVVRISRHGAERLDAGHVWVYASDVADRGHAAPGDVVRVADGRGRPLGVAHFSSTSQITLRLLARRPETIDASFWRARIEAAAQLRRRVVASSDAYRLVHSEGDLLPGLIIDRYGGWFVIQTLTQGMDRAKDQVAACLAELFSPAGIVERNDAPVRAKESLPLNVGILRGEVTERITISMNGLRLEADLLRGQKTGVFLDQRENYLAAARHARGAALDCFTSSGGFALHIAGRCERVEAVDSSEAALAQARRNAQQNAVDNVHFRQADVFELLAGFKTSSRRFSTIVLDPPAFTRSRANLDGAVRGYKDINLRAIQLLDPGGILITCSCSHHMPEARLIEAVAAASLDAGRTVRVLERRTQSADHPILLTVPETCYLKCLILEVL